MSLVKPLSQAGASFLSVDTQDPYSRVDRPDNPHKMERHTYFGMAMLFSAPDTPLTVTSMSELKQWIEGKDLAKRLHEAGAIVLQFGPELDPKVAIPVLTEAFIASLKEKFS